MPIIQTKTKTSTHITIAASVMIAVSATAMFLSLGMMVIAFLTSSDSNAPVVVALNSVDYGASYSKQMLMPATINGRQGEGSSANELKSFNFFQTGSPDINLRNESLPIGKQRVARRRDGVVQEISFNNFPLERVVKKNSVNNSEELADAANKFISDNSEWLGVKNLNLKITHRLFKDQPLSDSAPLKNTAADRLAGRISTVIFKQYIRNNADQRLYPVEGSMVVIAIKTGSDGNDRFALYKSTVFPDTEEISAQAPQLTSALAIEVSRNYLLSESRAYENISVDTIKAELVGYPAKQKELSPIRWAYKVTFPAVFLDNHIDKLVVVVDAISRDIVAAYSTLINEDITGSVSGLIYTQRPTQGQIMKSFGNNNIQVNDQTAVSGGTLTPNVGIYSANITPPVSLVAKLEGPFARVSDAQSSNIPIVHRENTTNYDIEWQQFDTSYRQEMSNAFYHVNVAHDYVTQPHIGAQEMNFPINVVVNIADSCNAYYDPSDQSVNFYQAGKNSRGQYCEASSLFSDVVIHEYGHAVLHNIIRLDWSEFPYWGESGNLDEAIGDYTACTVNNDPVLSEGFIGESALRRCDTSDRFPEDYDPEPHSGAQIVSGALWDIRTALQAKLGAEEGRQYADSLVYNGLRFIPRNFHEFLESLLITDNEKNTETPELGTEYKDIICDGFNEHGISIPDCAGFTENPIAQIDQPAGQYNTDEMVAIQGYSWSGKSADPISTIITIEYGVGVQPSSWTMIAYSVKPTSDGTFVVQWDNSRMEYGITFALRLTVRDSLGHRQVQTRVYQKAYPLHITINGVSRNEHNKTVYIAYRHNNKFEFSDPIPCPLKDNICVADIIIPEKSSDVITTLSEFSYNYGAKTLFFDHFDKISKKNLTYDFQDTQDVVTNIADIAVAKNIDPINMNSKIWIFYKDGWLVTYSNEENPMALKIFNAGGLSLQSYTVIGEYFGGNRDTGDIMSLSYSLTYPFTDLNRQFGADDVKTINMKINFPFKKLLQGSGYIFGDYSQFITYFLDNPSNEMNKVLKSENSITFLNHRRTDYTFTFSPRTKGGIGILYKQELGSKWVLADRGEGTIQNIFYNGHPDMSLASNELSNNIEVFGEPLSLDTRPMNANSRFYIGSLRDSFSFEPLLYQDISGIYQGRLLITTPDGQQLDIYQMDKIISGGWVYLPGMWRINCSDDTSHGNPSILSNASLFCQIGRYQVDWVFGDIFTDGRILELHREYYYNGTRFISDPNSVSKFLRGDANSDGAVDISDPVFILGFLFTGSPAELSCKDAADVNDEGIVDVSDAIFELNYLFTNTENTVIPAPSLDFPPYPGPDPTLDDLGCEISQ